MSYTSSPLRSRGHTTESSDRARRSMPADGARAGGAAVPATAGTATAASDLDHELDDEGPDWGRVGAFAAGIALGALIGTGAALLLAPQSGPELRRGLALRARSAKLDARDAWDDLGDQLSMLRRAARRKLRKQRRGARRSVTKGRWAVEDALVG